MRLEIYGEEAKKEEEPTILRLVAIGSVRYLVAVYGNGVTRNRGNILEFWSDGRIGRCEDVNPDLGFQLDKNGRVKVVGVKSDEDI